MSQDDTNQAPDALSPLPAATINDLLPSSPTEAPADDPSGVYTASAPRGFLMEPSPAFKFPSLVQDAVANTRITRLEQAVNELTDYVNEKLTAHAEVLLEHREVLTVPSGPGKTLPSYPARIAALEEAFASAHGAIVSLATQVAEHLADSLDPKPATPVATDAPPAPDASPDGPHDALPLDRSEYPVATDAPPTVPEAPVTPADDSKSGSATFTITGPVTETHTDAETPADAPSTSDSAPPADAQTPVVADKVADPAPEAPVGS